MDPTCPTQCISQWPEVTRHHDDRIDRTTSPTWFPCSLLGSTDQATVVYADSPVSSVSKAGLAYPSCCRLYVGASSDLNGNHTESARTTMVCSGKSRPESRGSVFTAKASDGELPATLTTT